MRIRKDSQADLHIHMHVHEKCLFNNTNEYFREDEHPTHYCKSSSKTTHPEGDITYGWIALERGNETTEAGGVKVVNPGGQSGHLCPKFFWIVLAVGLTITQP